MRNGCPRSALESGSACKGLPTLLLLLYSAILPKSVPVLGGVRAFPHGLDFQGPQWECVCSRQTFLSYSGDSQFFTQLLQRVHRFLQFSCTHYVVLPSGRDMVAMPLIYHLERKKVLAFELRGGFTDVHYIIVQYHISYHLCHTMSSYHNTLCYVIKVTWRNEI